MDELGTNLFLRDSLFLFFCKLRCQGGRRMTKGMEVGLRNEGGNCCKYYLILMSDCLARTAMQPQHFTSTLDRECTISY